MKMLCRIYRPMLQKSLDISGWIISANKQHVSKPVVNMLQEM